MAESEKVILTNMCMVYDGNKVLVQDRLNKNWKGLTFPGGHVEKHESFTDAVIREVYEETGPTIENPRLCGVKEWENEDGSRYMVLLYKTELFSGEVRSSNEGEVYWTPLGNLSKLRLTEHFDKILEIYLRDDLSEFFYKRSASGWEIQLL